MANRLKEDEKNERIIRGLLKLAENRRCINCNSLGPQYVCTNFWTFVCTNCSGIHREFTHRVKSVSMAKFTSQEVTALQEGGNQHAKEIYFKEWDPQRHSVPDSSNVERLRDFIKHVYVDRRYTGERNYDKSPKVKMGEKEDVYESRRTDAYRGGPRSPPYENKYERRYSDRSSPGGRSYDERSPGYGQESRQYGDYRRSPVHPEIVNDWRREDGFGNGRKFEDYRESDGDSKRGGRSPEQPKDLNSSSPPMVRPMREILGENVLPLHIIEPPKANGGRAANGSAHTQPKTTSPGSLGSNPGNPAEVKVEDAGSLIDFYADPEPPVAVAVPQPNQTSTTQSTSLPTTSNNDNNWASFDCASESKVSLAPSNANTLESLVSQLSVSASVPSHVFGTPGGAGSLATASIGNMTILPVTGHSAAVSVGNTPVLPFSPVAAPIQSLSMLPPGGAPANAPGLTPILPGSGQGPNMQHQQPSFFSVTGSQSSAQQYVSLVDGFTSNQQQNLSLTTNTPGPSSTPAAQGPQAFSKMAHVPTSGDVPEPSVLEAKYSARKELPADLFTATYPSFPAPIPMWQTGLPHGMGFYMQYNNALPVPTFQQTKSSNPFDLSSEVPQVQAPMFPSMASLQGALPGVPPATGLLRTSSLGTPSSAWMSAQASSYISALPPQAPSYALAVPTGSSYIGGQQETSNMPPSRHQGVGGFGNMDQQQAGRYSAPATPHPFSSAGGNPFG